MNLLQAKEFDQLDPSVDSAMSKVNDIFFDFLIILTTLLSFRSIINRKRGATLMRPM